MEFTSILKFKLISFVKLFFLKEKPKYLASNDNIYTNTPSHKLP